MFSGFCTDIEADPKEHCCVVVQFGPDQFSFSLLVGGICRRILVRLTLLEWTTL
jgi:hypothetical protein